MTDPALTSTRNHQGRPWFGPGAVTPVEVRVGPKPQQATDEDPEEA
jgi:hypothetical protein